MYETEGTFFNVSGWGDSETLEGSFQDGSDILKVIQIPFVPKSQCHLPKGRSGQRGKSKICAGGIPGTRESGINCIPSNHLSWLFCRRELLYRRFRW